MNSGWEVPLGILSALEPCGAILCANLPIIYRTILKGFQNIGSVVKSTKSTGYSNKTLSPASEDSKSHDWVRLNNDGSKGNNGFPKTSVTRGKIDSEQELSTQGIEIQQGFELEIQHLDRGYP
ncbi:hypothetical protein F5Y19DRAFT_481983 [Xylariaceae sp. FL1651]|nr:hypothetical protein F5Y19DRAFT_481983 [Xylariaceae sp. FL1651]